MKESLGEIQRSNFNTIKVHMMGHFTNCIKRSGLPWEYSTNMWEHFHIVHMKSAYRKSNKKDANAQIVKHNRRLDILRKIGQEMEDTNRVPVDKVTALDKVSFGDKIVGKIL